MSGKSSIERQLDEAQRFLAKHRGGANVQQHPPARSSEILHSNDTSDRDAKRREYDRFHSEVLMQLMKNLTKSSPEAKSKSTSSSSLTSAPTRFKTHDEYAETFLPLVMEVTRCYHHHRCHHHHLCHHRTSATAAPASSPAPVPPSPASPAPQSSSSFICANVMI
eukprot:768206-Hanusia_phi.AAC.1